MNKISMLVGSALLSYAVAFHASAQEPGAGTSTPQPYHKATAEEKAAGKAHRREEGRAAARDGNIGGEITKQPAAQAKVSKAERQESRAERKAETKRAAKAGELAPTGEVGASK